MELNQAQIQRALFLAAVCGQTYTQFTNPDGTFVLPPPYTLFEPLEAKSLLGQWERFGFIWKSADEIIIAFRGTSSASNWIADAIATQQKFKWAKDAGLTHRGFTGIYGSARRQIHSALRQLPEDRTLYLTGHSLGAALATLCAMDLAANTNRVPILFTFGSPRVGDPDFVQAFAKQVPNSYRIHNEFDPVTHIPPTIFKLPRQEKTYYYRHVPASYPLYFADASLSSNHSIGSYYAELAELDSVYAQHLSTVSPSFLPVP
jgi:triacylglycerol lipase